VALLCSEEAGWITGELIAVDGRAKEAILHRVRNLMAKTIRESLGAR
jgi:hypothetical protein